MSPWPRAIATNDFTTRKICEQSKFNRTAAAGCQIFGYRGVFEAVQTPE
jgi:hypothetical protein